MFIKALEAFTLFVNLGRAGFRDASYSSGIGLLGRPWSGWGTGIIDLNNDGLKDIFSANGHVIDNAELYGGSAYRQPNSVFVNVGDSSFKDGHAGLWKPHSRTAGAPSETSIMTGESTLLSRI